MTLPSSRGLRRRPWGCWAYAIQPKLLADLSAEAFRKYFRRSRSGARGAQMAAEEGSEPSVETLHDDGIGDEMGQAGER